MILAVAARIATAAAADGTANRPLPSDHSSQTLSGFTTCSATSGNGLRIAGTRTTTARQRTHRRGFAAAIRTTALFRGGSWRNESELVRTATRFRRNINVRFDTLGVRIARTMTE